MAKKAAAKKVTKAEQKKQVELAAAQYAVTQCYFGLRNMCHNAATSQAMMVSLGVDAEMLQNAVRVFGDI